MTSPKIFRPYYKIKEQLNLDLLQITPHVSRSWFYGNEIPIMYNFPVPTTNNYVVAVVSFGGGLYGNVSGSGVLTNGDVQKYWESLGILSVNMPKVVIKTIGGAQNNPSDFGSTVENTIDVENIGMCCPTSKLTIVLYIAPNSLNSFTTVLNTILNDTQYVANAISISWGAPEIYYGNTLLIQINNVLSSAVNKNITVTAATGDNGSNDGVGGRGSYCDFPSSSPNVLACGGTNLVCPNHIYDSQTSEIAWSSGGGGISSAFTKPTYQNNIVGTKRNTPDISLVSDPNTGVLYLINNTQYIVGGTSIAAPIFTGFLAASYTKNFINPIIYNVGLLSCHDITVGSNGAFQAKIGYDNCTGYGSIKGDVLTNIIKYTISVNTSSVILNKNAHVTISTTSNYNYNSYLTWTSANTNIATVNNSGVITGVGYGTTTVTLKTINPYVSKVITVIVRNLALTKLRLISNKYKKY
jgi:kumamolisin